MVLALAGALALVGVAAYGLATVDTPPAVPRVASPVVIERTRVATVLVEVTGVPPTPTPRPPTWPPVRILTPEPTSTATPVFWDKPGTGRQVTK